MNLNFEVCLFYTFLFTLSENYRIVTPLRLLIIQKSNPELVDRLNYLMDHTKERKENEELWKSHLDFVEKLRR